MKWSNPGGSYPRLYADMVMQPHLLIAGATCSGKSTLINNLITVLLHDAPDGCEFILIDPKKVELSEYEALPHTRAYADEPADMMKALRDTLQIIDARYKTMKRQGLKEWPASHIYLIIDEMADLLTLDATKKEAVELLQRIAQIGRAAAVHMIVATQHIPTIPTSIRSNLDARVALKTTTPQDSRNVMFRTGAEKLPSPKRAGTCYAYYVRDGETGLYELPTFTPAEHQRLVSHWKAQRPAWRMA